MLVKGLNVFRTRDKNEKLIEVDFELLPLSYKYFIKCFNGINVDFVQINDDLIELTCVNFRITIDDEVYENSLAYIYNIQEIKKEIFLYKKRQENYHTLGYIKIGYFDISDSLLLKIEGKNSGEIWKLNGDWGIPLPYVQKLSDDIFDFSDHLEKDIIIMNLKVRGVDLNNVVKKFNNDNWEVIKEVL